MIPKNRKLPDDILSGDVFLFQKKKNTVFVVFFAMPEAREAEKHRQLVSTGDSHVYMSHSLKRIRLLSHLGQSLGGECAAQRSCGRVSSLRLIGCWFDPCVCTNTVRAAVAQ